MIVVDTNVISELMRSAPADPVAEWASAQSAPSLYTTAVTVAEVLYGIERLPAGGRRDALLATASDVFDSFSEKILSFDSEAAHHYARIVQHRDQIGRPINGFDAQIAAICRAYGAALATRNVKDFGEVGLRLIDPWQPAQDPK